MFEKLNDYQIKKWYKEQIKKQAIKDGIKEPQLNKQVRLQHDMWNAYLYGNNVIKIVYIKTAKSLPKSKHEDFFEYSPEELKLLDYKKHPKEKTPPKTPEGERFKNSISRAKARIFELAICNEFSHFCTFTQDKKMRDRFDLTEFRKDFAQMVRNINRDRDENSKIKYLLIPEQHKNGAWHLHGFLKGFQDGDLRPFKISENIPKKIKDTIKSGTPVFDWTRYRKAFGYFTCTEIDNQIACSKYITKYISKEFQNGVREKGEHLFFASQGLKSREIIAKKSLEKCPIEQWDFENDYVKIAEFKIDSDSGEIKPLSKKTDS